MRNSDPIRFQISRSIRPRTGGVNPIAILSIVAVLGLVGIGAFFLLKPGERVVDEPLTAVVEKGVFIAEVLDQGEIQSSDNVEFRCEVQSRYSNKGISILEVVDEGVMVNEGDVLVKLDSAELEAQLETQQIAVTNSKDLVAAAENRLKAAEVSLKEYEEGTYVAQEKAMQNEELLAEEDRRKAVDFYKHSQRLAAKRYITDDQLQADKFAVKRYENALALARKQLKVLKEITKLKMTTEFQSEIDSAKSRLTAAQESLAIEERQMSEIKTQIAACTITVPEGVSGQVTYANIFSSRGNSEWVLEPGATVREKQVMIRLPNRDLMQVKATVNESRITSIKKDMPVEVQVDALGQKTLDGVVEKVNQYPEPGGWGSGGVKKYAVYVAIKNPPLEIRPGMNAAVNIQVARREGALMAPLQSIYGVGKRTFCLKKSGEEWETAEIDIEMSNNQQVLINSGVDERDVLAMNPGAYRDLLKIPADALAELEDAEEPEDNSDNSFDESSGGKNNGKERPAGKGKGRKGGGKNDGGKQKSSKNAVTKQDTTKQDTAKQNTAKQDTTKQNSAKPIKSEAKPS